MARTAITVTETGRTTAPEPPAQQTSDNVNNMSLAWNDGKILLELNATGGACTFEILIPGLVDTQTVPALKIELAEGKTKMVGPLPQGIYNQPDGTVSVNASSNKGKIRAYHLGS